MNQKKLLALLVVGAMACSSLVGCGSNESSKENSSAEKEVIKESSQQKTEESKEVKEDPVVVTWCVRGEEPEDHDLVMESLNEDLREKINVELNLQWIADGEYDDRMKLMINSGEDFDLCYTANWTNRFYDNVSKDAYLDVTDLLNEYGQDILAQVPEWAFDVAVVDGGLYGIPNYQIMTEQYCVSVQKEFLEKYNFDLSTVKEYSDLEPFLEQIRDNEEGYYPVHHSTRDYLVKQEYEVIANGQVCLKIGTDDVELVLASEAKKEQQLFFLDWYKRGFYREDMLTVTDDSADQKAAKYVCLIQTYKPGVDAETSQKYGVEFVSQPMGKPYVSLSSGITAMTAINVNSKNPEAAMKLLNLMHADEEVFNKLLFGLEGVHYNKVGDNRVELIEGSKYYKGGSAWMLANQCNAWLIPGQDDNVWEETDRMNNESNVSPIRGFTLNQEPIQSELAQLAAVSSEYNNMELVAEDLDAFFEERDAKLDAAGQNKVLEEVQKQIDEWTKVNK